MAQSLTSPENVLLAALGQPGDQGHAEESLRELERLAESAGARVAGRVIQRKAKPDPALYFGKGKVESLGLEAQALACETLIVDDELKPSQQRELEKALGIKVIDRTQLILDIFAQRASTNEGKLQVELAQLSYLLPRLVGMNDALSRLGGGIGTRGPGETKIEVDRRRLRDRMSQLLREMDDLSRTRGLHRQARKRARARVVALAGYTNAGKSTLFNSLTQSQVFTQDRLFATLDPTTRPLNLGSSGALEVLLSDTVGFIRKLPHTLVAAFRATLEEVVDADVIVRVVDGSSAQAADQLATVDEVLEKIFSEKEVPGLKGRETLLVINKCDLLAPAQRRSLQEAWPRAYMVSAQNGEGLEALALELRRRADKGLKRAQYLLPPEVAGLLAKHYDELSVIDQVWTPEGLRASVILKSPQPELEPYRIKEPS